mmetsp:Transcript_86690/g.234945  ORF Transcript_86690/g.234945 Transcript_86690/m.234945 type:complete len:272 (+) Transcript_86690:861-1676(+)
MDLEGRVEHVAHHHEVQLLHDVLRAARPHRGLRPLELLHAQAVQPQEPADERPGILLEVVEVAPQHLLQQGVLLGRHCLHHVLSVSGVVEECTALPLGGELREGGQVAEDHVAEQLLGPHGLQVVLVADAEARADPLEHERGVVHEAGYGHPPGDRGVEDVRQARDDAELLLYHEVHRLQLPGDLVPDAPHGHPDADHHAEDHVPVLVPEVHRQAFLRAEQPVSARHLPVLAWARHRALLRRRAHCRLCGGRAQRPGVHVRAARVQAVHLA